MVSKRTLTNLEYALLGLVNQAPQTGYQLCKIFETSPIGHYSSSPGSIYPALNRLEKRGLLHARVERQSTMRPRRVFSVSQDGRHSLREWVTAPVDKNVLFRDEDGVMLRFAFMDAFLQPAETVAFLQQLSDTTSDLIADLNRHHQEISRASEAHTATGTLALEYGISSYRNLARWAKRTASKVANKN
ncbi:MAG: PadR family transcriptional regulator [Gammaproteobacteria bacterium]|nr:PadR family transcriptional regulator [Gammaproteobacteria bacterium]MDH3417095.1 PadR family transcriptional regulator [Gammaproteobacteria bacterium]